MTLRLVAAVADNGVIGHRGGIPWRLPADFAHFKQATSGHTLVMGRATYESIGRPLPGRPNVVLTRDESWSADGVAVRRSLADALAEASGDVAIIGGAGVYAEALPLADELVLTEVHAAPVGDTFFPEFDRSGWRELRREPGPDEPEGPAYEWIWLVRQPTG